MQRTFQRVLGVSPNQYRAHKRAAALRARLADPDVRITDAVYDAGYSGPARAYSNARLGMRMQDYRNRGRDQEIGYTIGASPLGRVLVASDRPRTMLGHSGVDGSRIYSRDLASNSLPRT